MTKMVLFNETQLRGIPSTYARTTFDIIVHGQRNLGNARNLGRV